MSAQPDNMLYDPPSGWKYGFPRPYNPLPNESLADTLLRDGYPQREIDNGGARHCRFIGRGAREVVESVYAGTHNQPVYAPADTAREQSAPANDNAPARERIGDWISTYTGRQAYPMDLRPSEIHVADISHSLAMQCRYTGHCRNFYSVAEHSVLMARHFIKTGMAEYALPALLHDATEAYLTDVPRPIKHFLIGYKEAEAKAWLAIAERFGVDPILSSHVHQADARILNDEVAQNMVTPLAGWGLPNPEPLGVTLQYWTPAEAEREFLDEFWALIETGRM